MDDLDYKYISFKQLLLFFDVIAIPQIELYLKLNYGLKPELKRYNDEVTQEIEYLLENELIIDPIDKYLSSKTYHSKFMNFYREYKDKIKGHISREDPNDFGKKIKEYNRRGIAIDMRKENRLNAFPIFPSFNTFNNEFLNGKNDVLQIILKSLPYPDPDSTSWEQIIDFKNDPNSIKMMVFLRHWINKITHTDISFNELFEEIEYLTNKYEEHMRLHKIKFRNGILETFLTISAEALEGIVRLKPTYIVKSIFSLKHRKVQLFESELNAPGNELAYLVRAREKFN